MAETEVPIDPHRLLVDGVLESCTDEMLQLYISLIFNAELDETFKIEEFRRNRRRVMLKFNRAFNFDKALERQKKMPELTSSLITIGQVKIPDTIRVSELANSCTKEVLNLYFSNSKMSQGGDIESIKLFSHENKALIQFADYSIINQIVARTHIICESLVKIDKYYGPIEDEFFLEEEEALEQSDTSNGRKKSLASLATLKSFTTPLNTIDKTKIVLSDIQENINIQQLDFFIQILCNRQEINSIHWSLENKSKLLIDFKKEIDINKVLTEFNSNNFNNLNSKPIQIETVNLTRTLVVLVKDTKPKLSLKLDSQNEDDEYKPQTIPATRDLLDLYFSNRQRSGGSDIESIERKSSRYWIIEMREQRVVQNILSRKHNVDDKPIKVFPYYENFGLPYMFRPIFDDLSSRSVVFKLKIKDERLRYFCKVKNLHKKLNEILSESNAESKYNKQESNILYVNYVERLNSKVPYTERMWRLKVKESIEYFLQVYKFEKLTLSHQQWLTISKTKQLNGYFLTKSGKGSDDNEIYQDTDMVDASLGDKIKYISNNCAIISINETASNVEISIVGPNLEVDRFIVKIKDVICKAYFTFELEEKIIKFKTYLYECEELLNKWLNEADGTDMESEITLASARSNDSDSFSANYSKRSDGGKLNKSRKNTIDEFLSKLERDHLDMELSYGKLFQELGYTFLSGGVQEKEEEDDGDYKDFNDRLTTSLDESVVLKQGEQTESQMDKIKYTLDDLRNRINDMRKKFRQFVIKSKRSKSLKDVDLSEDGESEFDDIDNEEDSDMIKLCIYVKDQAKIVTFNMNRKCKVKELKQVLLEKCADAEVESINELKLTFNSVELSNNNYTITDYNIGDKSTITLEFK
ncbi:poly [ADP-ribose] polymerase 14-like [Brachionus plicatilis]|uniref:Poly [ADP-ribose] polymerase 14-like n=1 Tax=Brachionus plicatilis TaxID=10195 RepID=A0A3M7QW54_BRAPC|nr:poly [ADP-ribose] polymerase 14-like [Brachionus plicatilis]